MMTVSGLGAAIKPASLSIMDIVTLEVLERALNEEHGTTLADYGVDPEIIYCVHRYREDIGKYKLNVGS